MNKTQQQARQARERACATCGAVFYPRLEQLRLGHGRFCSQKCNTAGHAGLAAASRLAAARWKELDKAGLITRRRGPDNPLWRGGKKESVRRDIESGKTAAQTKRWRRANPDKFRGYVAKRSKKGAKLPKGTVQRIGDSQRWRCAICRRSIRSRYHVDHIHPLSRGGDHVPRNIQLLCVSCNVRKQARDPIDYMRSLGRLL